MATPSWFSAEAYLTNKLATLPSSYGITTLPQLMVAFEKAGFAGADGAYKHFQMFGDAEGISPNAYFNATQYLQAKAVAALGSASDYNVGLVASAIDKLGMSAWDHYQKFGATEGDYGINPSNAFDQQTYLEAKAALAGSTVTAVKAAITGAGMTVLQHYMQFAGQTGEVSLSTNVAVPADKQVGGTTGRTFTLTTGIDNVVGTSGNDAFIGGNGAVNTYGPADQLDGGAGVDTVKLYGGALGADIPTLKNIENVYVNAVTGGANVSGIAGVESLEVENIGFAQTFTMGAAQSLKLTNINAATFATSVAGSAAGGITLNKVVDTTVTPNVAQTLDVQTRDAALKLTATGAASNINLTNTLAGAATSLTTLNVEGDAGLRVNGAAAYTNLTTVDASKNTGGVNFVQGVDTNLTFTGGTGNDRVDVSIAAGVVSAQDKLDGGAGTDTLAITTGGLTAPAVANIKNFETLEVRGATAQDASVFDAHNTWEGLVVQNLGAAQVASVTNLAATAKDGIVVNHSGAAANTIGLTTTVKGFLAGGTSDSATVTVNASAVGSLLNLTFDNVDVLNLVSKTTVAGNTNVINLTTTDVEKVVVTGNTTTTVTPGVTTLGITEVDASGLVVANGTTAGLTFAQTAAAPQSLLVTGSNGLDTITVTSAKGTVVANGGNDTITFSTAAAALGDQSVNLSAKDFVAAGALNVTYTLGVGGSEVINFSSDIEALLKIGGVNLGTTTANQLVGAAINGQNNVAWNNVAKVLQFDVNGDGVFNVADDLQITLTGTATPVTTVTYNATNDFFVLA